MATIRKRGNTYSVKMGRRSITFKTKSEANAWAVDQEREIENFKKRDYA